MSNPPCGVLAPFSGELLLEQASKEGNPQTCLCCPAAFEDCLGGVAARKCLCQEQEIGAEPAGTPWKDQWSSGTWHGNQSRSCWGAAGTCTSAGQAWSCCNASSVVFWVFLLIFPDPQSLGRVGRPLPAPQCWGSWDLMISVRIHVLTHPGLDQTSAHLSWESWNHL